ncbi:hypothetical protein LTR16_003756, partial [Cryomyces antarcticus]
MAPTTRSMTGSLRKTQRYSPEPFQKARVKKRAGKKGKQTPNPTKTKKKKAAPSKTKKPGANKPAARKAAAPKKPAAGKPATKKPPPNAPTAARRWKTSAFPNLGPRTSPRRPTSAVSTLTEMTSAISTLTLTSSTTGPVSDTIIETVEVDEQGNPYSGRVANEDEG